MGRGALQAVEAHAEELFSCLGRPTGLECDLAQTMMSYSIEPVAEQFVSVLQVRSDDEQDPTSRKKNVERFVWQYLANRTHTGEPTQVAHKDNKMVDCTYEKQPCGDGQVCVLLCPCCAFTATVLSPHWATLSAHFWHKVQRAGHAPVHAGCSFA